MFPSWSELSPAGFDRSLRLNGTGAGNTPAPPLPSPATGLPREGGGEAASVVLERKNGQQGQRPKEPYKQQHAWSTHHTLIPATHTHTHTPQSARVAFHLPSSHQPMPISPLETTPCSANPPWLILRPQDCPQENNVSQVPQGLDLYTLTPALARGIRGNEAQAIPPSSTFLPPLPGTNQMTRCPHLTMS